MFELRRFCLIAGSLVGIALGAQPVSAKTLPAHLCALLPAGVVSRTLGQTYGAPQESVAPAPFANTNTGTDCNYYATGTPASKLWFRMYVDPSPSAATDLFAKLKVFYSPPTAVSQLGDEAYFDPQHALHVRKGKVRFYLNLSPLGSSTSAEKQLEKLARLVLQNSKAVNVVRRTT
jgi:hypothetical protein